MSDSNRVKLTSIEEASWGVTPDNPAQTERIVSETLSQSTNTQFSSEIASDRQKSDAIRTGFSASGDVNTELSLDTFDTWFANLLMSAGWSSDITVSNGTDVVFASSGSTITDPTDDFVVAGITVGMWIKVSGSTSNDGTYKVLTVTSSVVTVQGSLTDEAAGATVTITGLSQIVNGVATPSLTLQKQYTDLPTTFANYTGMMINTGSIEINQDEVIKCTFGFLGKKEESGSSVLGSNVVDKTTTTVCNSVDHVPNVLYNNSTLGIIGTTISINNNLRARTQVGVSGLQSIGTGSAEITGTLRAYFTSQTQLDDYLAHTQRSLDIRITNGSEQLMISLPAIKLSDGKRVATGENTDIITDLSFQAFKDATQGVTIRMSRDT